VLRTVLIFVTSAALIVATGFVQAEAQNRDDLNQLDYDRILAAVSNRQSEFSELAQARVLLEQVNPHLVELASAGQTYELAQELMSTIYWSIPQVASPDDSPWYDLDHLIADSIGRQRGHICGGLSMNFVVALASFGFRHRAVGLFSDIENYDSHVSVEVLIGNRWIIFDPTFNLNFVDEQTRYLSWYEVRNQCLRGVTPNHQIGVGGARPGDEIETYYAPICDLVQFMVFSPTIGSPAIVLPQNWDGIVLQNGVANDVVVSYTHSRIYTLAANYRIYPHMFSDE